MSNDPPIPEDRSHAVDLLHVPKVLRRRACDDPPLRLDRGRIIVMPKYRPVKAKRRPKEISFGLRLILHDLGWTDKVIDRLSPKEAGNIADMGRMMLPVDEIRKRE